MSTDINQRIAGIFTAKADALSHKGERFRYRAMAYRRAANALNKLDHGVDEIYARSWLKGLQKIEGIGNRLAHDIENELKKISKK